MAVTNSGVGIGTTNPSANLYIVGNVYASIALQTPNLLTTTANIGTLNVTGTATASFFVGGANTLSNINASNLAFGVVPSSLIYGNTLSNINASNITQPFTNLAVSNSLTTTNVFATRSNITTMNATSIFGTAGNVGIGTASPQSTLHVIGNVYASNALQTTNLVASGNVTAAQFMGIGGFAPVAGGPTLGVTGNVYASNALQTTNIVAAGFTSNATNTNFNYDTLTVPFVSCTTMNVASVSNIAATYATTLNVSTTSNIAATYATTMNVSTTSNIAATYATTLNVASTSNINSSLAVTGSVICSNPFDFKNRIINGAMTIWQRNVASITTTASLYTTADRWCGALGTSGLLLSQWPGPTENLSFPYSLQVTTSTTTTGTPLIEQRIEYLNIPDFLNGTPVSVSFYAGQNYGTLMPLTVGLYYATAVNNFGTQTLAVAATQNTPTLTASNVYYSLSFTLNTGLAATNGLALRFTTGASSALGSNFLLTGVQVEKGPVATPFERRPYPIELALAQRYYYQLTSPTAAALGISPVYANFGTATGVTTTDAYLPISMPVPMRSNAYTTSNSIATSWALLPTGTTTITGLSFQTDSYTPVGVLAHFIGTNIVAGSSYVVRTAGLTGTTTAFMGISAEL
jgi:hypothetical protein